MSSLEVFNAMGDWFYMLFQATLEPTGEMFWKGVLLFGFFCFGYWMYRQAKFNKIAKNDPDQLK